MKEWSLCFLQPSDSPKSKSQRLSMPNVMGVCLPDVEPLGWGAQTPHSFGRTSAVVIILLFVGCVTRGVGLDYTASLPLLLILLWILFYIFICRSFQLVFGSLS